MALTFWSRRPATDRPLIRKPYGIRRPYGVHAGFDPAPVHNLYDTLSGWVLNGVTE